MGVFERFVFIVLFHIINDVFKKAVHPKIIRPTIILSLFHLFIFHTIKALTSQFMNVFRFEINISDTKSSPMNVLNTNLTFSWKTECKNTNRFRVNLKDVLYFLGNLMVFFGQLWSLKTTVDDVPQKKKSWIWNNMRVNNNQIFFFGWTTLCGHFVVFFCPFWTSLITMKCC